MGLGPHPTTTAPTAECPLCGLDTHRVHSRYSRRLDDLPCLGRCVRLQLAVRRFVCPQSDCPRRIFAERLPGFAAPWARTTDRLRQTQTDIGSSLGGEAGARLASRMAITTSPECHEVKRNSKIALHLRSVLARFSRLIVDMHIRSP
jgi:transposase